MITLLSKNHTPIWIKLLIDLSICAVSVPLAFLIRYNMVMPDEAKNVFYIPVLIILSARALFFIIFGIHKSISRYTNTEDIVKLFFSILLGSLLIGLINIIIYYIHVPHKFYIPTSVIFIDFLFTLVSLTGMRLAAKIYYLEYTNPRSKKTNVVIFGAGDAGIIAKRALDRDAGSKYKVIAFIDENPQKIGKKLEDAPIYGLEKLSVLLSENNIAHVIIAVQNIKTEKKQEIIEKCLSYNVKVLNVPPVNNWINGELSFKQIKKVQIDDLLGRDEIKLDINQIQQKFANKVILVTGAAGSIGSEIVRQILTHINIRQIIIVDQAETPLHDLDIELSGWSKSELCKFFIGDVTNHEQMQWIFETYHPEIVFHAAAYKHVPVMEANPSAAIQTNVKGTKTLADLSIQYNVERFVMVSTDKAVNPTNVMGASKRIAEIYVQSLNHNGTTKFITTRFGNVLGSNGSVIPLFEKQIKRGGIVTITHPEITRYFMTIPEACRLVLEAGCMGNGGEIFVFDMGKSVKIVDLAKKMIQLSGLTLGKDIEIVYTGLRPGEKLYEELLNNAENTIPTHHQKIMIAKVREYDKDLITNQIEQLIKFTSEMHDNLDVVRQMKQIVPEYKSQHSIYEVLDK